MFLIVPPPLLVLLFLSHGWPFSASGSDGSVLSSELSPCLGSGFASGSRLDLGSGELHNLLQDDTRAETQLETEESGTVCELAQCSGTWLQLFSIHVVHPCCSHGSRLPQYLVGSLHSVFIRFTPNSTFYVANLTPLLFIFLQLKFTRWNFSGLPSVDEANELPFFFFFHVIMFLID